MDEATPQPQHVDELKPGDVFVGQFRIEKEVGRGGMGFVYKAFDLKYESDVALKTVSYIAPDSGERFMREAKCLRKVESDNIVRLLDAGIFEGRPYLAMEYLRGESLREHMRKEGPLSISRAVDITAWGSHGLARCHFKHGLIHRDIKPANIFLCRPKKVDEKVKILDFGISVYPRAADVTGPHRLGSAGVVVMGTWNYMAPEQMEGYSEVRSDQYSMALVLYECLTGQLPYPPLLRGNPTAVAEFANRVMRGPRNRGRIRHDVPAELEGAILRALSLDIDDRFPNIYQFLEAILPFASGDVIATLKKMATAPVAELVDENSLPATPEDDSEAPTQHERDIGTIDNRFVKTIVRLATGATVALPASSTGAKYKPGETKAFPPTRSDLEDTVKEKNRVVRLGLADTKPADLPDHGKSGIAASPLPGRTSRRLVIGVSAVASFTLLAATVLFLKRPASSEARLKDLPVTEAKWQSAPAAPPSTVQRPVEPPARKVEAVPSPQLPPIPPEDVAAAGAANDEVQPAAAGGGDTAAKGESAPKQPPRRRRKVARPPSPPIPLLDLR